MFTSAWRRQSPPKLSLSKCWNECSNIVLRRIKLPYTCQIYFKRRSWSTLLNMLPEHYTNDNYTRLQKRWHATSVYNNHKLDVMNDKSYPNFPGRKRFIMRKDFPWIMREVNHWLCICANISHKGVGSCRSWIKLIRCQRFCNRVYHNWMQNKAPPTN